MSDRELDEVEASSQSGELGARVRRFASLRAARRAKFSMPPKMRRQTWSDRWI